VRVGATGREGKKTALMQALRDGAFADRLMLMQDGRAAALGTPREVLTADGLRAAFEMDVAGYMREALRRWETL
jgi:ABC-type hemin transport system ATPase subunit